MVSYESTEATRNIIKKFLKEHAEEWWTPHDIKKELGGDIRTYIRGIRSLSRRPGEMTYKGWKLEVAARAHEQEDRIYAVRIIRYIEVSDNVIKAEISEVKVSRIGVHTSSKIKQTQLNTR